VESQRKSILRYCRSRRGTSAPEIIGGGKKVFIHRSSFKEKICGEVKAGKKYIYPVRSVFGGREELNTATTKHFGG